MKHLTFEGHLKTSHTHREHLQYKTDIVSLHTLIAYYFIITQKESEKNK